MPMNRRDLLRSLGLGAGATFMFPWVERTLSYAMGQSVAPRRRVIVVGVNGWDAERYLPVEITSGRSQEADQSPPAINPMTNFTWPEMFSPIEDLRQSTLFIDGLTNPVQGSNVHHGIGYGALTCQQPQGDPDRLGPPRGTSIDQYLAQTLSANAPKSSLLFGTSSDSFSTNRARHATMFSAGDGQSLSHATKASALYDEIVGLATTDPDEPVEDGRRQALRDALRTDFARLRQRLAGPERERLDVYETAITEFDRRYELRETVSCDAPPSARDGSETSRMESMMDMATLALECGLTNVVGVAVGTPDSHDTHFPRYDGIGTISVHDYGSAQYGALLDEVHKFHWRKLREMLDALEASGSPDDETIVIYFSPRGNNDHGSHHGTPGRWPVMMLARSSNIQLGGRVLRYPTGERSFAEFCRSLCQVVGVCPDGFATGSNVVGPVRGLLSEVVGSSQSACG
jgi:hypothetical protein